MGSHRSLAFQQRSSCSDCIAFLGVFQNSRGPSVQLNLHYSELSAAQRGSCPAQTAAIKTEDTQTPLHAPGSQTGMSCSISPCRAGQEQSPGDSQDLVRQRVCPASLRGCTGHGTRHCPATAPAVLTRLLHQQASRDGRNYLEDRPLCFIAILVTSGCFLLIGKRFAAY